MLGKLIKNELKSSANSLLNIYLATIIAVTLLLIVIRFSAGNNKIMALCTFILIATSFLIILITIFAVIINFNRTLYGSQGYLSFTLPVKIRNLLASKVIVSFFWILLSYLICIAIWAGLIAFATTRAGDARMATIKGIADLITTQTFGFAINGKAIIELLTLLCFFLFVNILLMVSKVFLSISIANIKVSKKNTTAIAIFVFFVITIPTFLIWLSLTTSGYKPLLYLASDGLAISFSKSTMAGIGGLDIMGLSGYVFYILVTAVLFVFTSYLMKNKINVK